MQYAIVHNAICNSIVALPSTAVLNDLAFEKGWRIIHQDVSFLKLQDWKEQFINMEVKDEIQFYLDHLVEEEMTEEDTLYIESLMSERCYDPIQPDADEEEFDENFSSFEDTSEETEE